MIGFVLGLACACAADSIPAPRPPAREAPTVQQTATDRWFGSDKVKHFLMSAFIHSATFSVSRAAGLSRSNAQATAGVTSAAFGIAKEIHDKRNSRPFSGKDLVWDAGGAATAAALLNRTR